jgi:hypothetical protein
MTLLASVASLFCSFSVSAAVPAVAVVPAESVNRVEIISPIVEDSAALDSESLALADPGDSGEVADGLGEAGDFTPDKLAAASDDELLLPADVVADDELLPADVVLDGEELLPADVIVDGEELLPADVIVDGEEILPADVVADIDAENDAISAAEAEGVAIAEAAASTTQLFDEDPAEDVSPTPAPAEEPGAKNDSGEASGDGEAAS